MASQSAVSSFWKQARCILQRPSSPSVAAIHLDARDRAICTAVMMPSSTKSHVSDHSCVTPVAVSMASFVTQTKSSLMPTPATPMKRLRKNCSRSPFHIWKR